MSFCSFAESFGMFDITPVENLFIEEYMARAPGGSANTQRTEKLMT